MSTVQGDIGVVIGLSEAELQKGIARVNQALTELAKTVEQIGQRIDKAMAQAAGGAQEAARATKELSEEEKAAAEASRKAAEEKRRLAEAQKQAADAARQHKKALDDMRQGLQQISTAAGIMSAAMGLIAKTSSDAYKQQQSAFLGLESVAQKTVGDVDAVKQAVQSLTEDGLMTLVEASQAVQAGLATGFSLQETIDLINAFKDAAAFNRQAGLEFGEAVVRAMEGVRMGNSVLSDAAGITKNLSQILKEAGYAEQDLQRVSTDAAVRRALYNGILREGALFAGNAAKAAETLAGADARAATAAFEARAAFGEALAPALQALADTMTSVLGKLTDFVEANPELARTAFLVAGGITVMTAAVGGLTAAFLALNAALGPIGWSLMGISAVVGALGGYAASVESAGRAAARQKEELNNLVTEYRQLTGIIQDTTRSQDEHRAASERLQVVLDQLRAISPDLVSGYRLQEDALESLNKKLDESIQKANLWKGIWLGIRTAFAATQNPVIAQAIAPEVFGPEESIDFNVKDLNTRALRAWQKSRQGYSIFSVGSTGGTTASVSTSASDRQMSPALAAALEDLADLQALERTPENLQRQLAKVREILDRHGAELERLGRKRDLERLRDIVLPREIQEALDQATSAQFRQALEQVQADIQLKGLTPEQVRQRLEEIQQQFADYLTAHPDQALQLELRIKGARDEELRAPLERWRQVLRQNEQLGLYEGVGGLNLKLSALRAGLGLALGAGDESAIFEIAGQIRQVEQALQQADFEGKFNRIKQAREQAFAGAAEDLARLERELTDAEAAGDSQLAAQIRQRMLDAVRPALEEQRRALEELLQDEALTATQRAQVEAELNRVKQELYDQDTQAHRIATDAKLAAERQAAQERQRLEQQVQSWIRALADADLERIRERQQAEEESARRRIKQLQEEKRAAEEAQEARIRALQDELDALERLWAAEDRRRRIADLRAELAEVMADTRYQKVDPVTGQVIWTYDEARARELQQQIAEAEREDERARLREALQDRIQHERDRLDAIRRSYDEEIQYEQERLEALRDAHAQELEERQEFWNRIQSVDLEAFAALVDAAKGGLDNWIGVFKEKLPQLESYVKEKVESVRRALESLTSLVSSAREIATPTLPASLSESTGAARAGTSVSVGTIHVSANLPNVTDAKQFVKELPGEMAKNGLDLGQLISSGRAGFRAGLRPV